MDDNLNRSIEKSEKSLNLDELDILDVLDVKKIEQTIRREIEENKCLIIKTNEEKKKRILRDCLENLKDSGLNLKFKYWTPFKLQWRENFLEELKNFTKDDFEECKYIIILGSLNCLPENGTINRAFIYNLIDHKELHLANDLNMKSENLLIILFDTDWRMLNNFKKANSENKNIVFLNENLEVENFNLTINNTNINNNNTQINHINNINLEVN